MTYDTWHVTCDTWHQTGGGRWTFVQNFSSLPLTVWEWRFVGFHITNATIKSCTGLRWIYNSLDLLHMSRQSSSVFTDCFRCIHLCNIAPVVCIRILLQIFGEFTVCLTDGSTQANNVYYNIFQLTIVQHSSETSLVAVWLPGGQFVRDPGMTVSPWSKDWQS